MIGEENSSPVAGRPPNLSKKRGVKKEKKPTPSPPGLNTQEWLDLKDKITGAADEAVRRIQAVSREICDKQTVYAAGVAFGTSLNNLIGEHMDNLVCRMTAQIRRRENWWTVGGKAAAFLALGIGGGLLSRLF